MSEEHIFSKTIFRRSVQYQSKQSHDLRIVSPDCASSPTDPLKTYRLLPYRHEVSANRTCERPDGPVFHLSPFSFISKPVFYREIWISLQRTNPLSPPAESYSLNRFIRNIQHFLIILSIVYFHLLFLYILKYIAIS